MVFFEARWDITGSGERPLVPEPGWTQTDSVDVADQVSERAPTAGAATWGRASSACRPRPWSVYWSTPETLGQPRVGDGGRTIFGRRGERFHVCVDGARTARLVRVGGLGKMAYSNVGGGPVTLTVRSGARARPPRGAAA